MLIFHYKLQFNAKKKEIILVKKGNFLFEKQI